MAGEGGPPGGIPPRRAGSGEQQPGLRVCGAPSEEVHEGDLGPFLPETAGKILAMLGLPENATLAAEWGTALTDGHMTRKPDMLFPRIETDAV